MIAWGKGDDEDFYDNLPSFEVVSEDEITKMTRMAENLKQDLESKKKVQTALRFNSGKTQTREVYPAFIMGIAEVLTKSRDKYPSFNWCKPTKLSTPYESLMRHLMAFQMGEDFDVESGKHHLLHCATNLMFMYYQITNNPEFSDDRFFGGKTSEEE
jgi:hypothetical protein